MCAALTEKFCRESTWSHHCLQQLVGRNALGRSYLNPKHMREGKDANWTRIHLYVLPGRKQEITRTQKTTFSPSNHFADGRRYGRYQTGYQRSKQKCLLHWSQSVSPTSSQHQRADVPVNQTFSPTLRISVEREITWVHTSTAAHMNRYRNLL